METFTLNEAEYLKGRSVGRLALSDTMHTM